MAAKDTFHDPPTEWTPDIASQWGFALFALIWTATVIGIWSLVGCAYTAVEMKPDGSLSYYSSKNTRAVAKDSDGDGVVDEYEIVGDASTVINAQAEAFRAGVEAGRAIAP